MLRVEGMGCGVACLREALPDIKASSGSVPTDITYRLVVGVRGLGFRV